MHLDSVPCNRGRLVSIEGISGVGKTYLTTLLHADTTIAEGSAPIILEEFSQRSRSARRDLGRDLLRVLIDAAGGDRLLRGGHPAAETLLLLAIKMYDYESCLPALRQGRHVLEGRSLHTTAVYQSLIMHADDDQAASQARVILELASQWRPLPDLTILITDDVSAAVHRAEQRDAKPYTAEQRRLHHRAAALFEQLAADDPTRLPILDRRTVDTDNAVRLLRTWIGSQQSSNACLVEPWRAHLPHAAGCWQQCRLTQPPRPTHPTATAPTATG